jgi:hypothetical protein
VVAPEVGASKDVARKQAYQGAGGYLAAQADGGLGLVGAGGGDVKQGLDAAVKQ